MSDLQIQDIRYATRFRQRVRRGGALAMRGGWL
jgi:hypothetical protein